MFRKKQAWNWDEGVMKIRILIFCFVIMPICEILQTNLHKYLKVIKKFISRNGEDFLDLDILYKILVRASKLWR